MRILSLFSGIVPQVSYLIGQAIMTADHFADPGKAMGA